MFFSRNAKLYSALAVALFALVALLAFALMAYTSTSPLTINGKQHLADVIMSQGYFDRLDKTNLKVRGCTLDGRSCMEKYLHGVREPTPAEKDLLEIYTGRIDARMSPESRLRKIPWRVLFFDDKSEGGFPHTHGDCIMLPYKFLTKHEHEEQEHVIDTLLHEKVHVYQRMFPFDFLDLYLRYWGFGVLGLASQRIPGIRSNPDTNDVLFADSSGVMISPAFKKLPTGLGDIVDTRDHPNEMAAYMLPRIIIGTDYGEKGGERVRNGLVSWAKKYVL